MIGLTDIHCHLLPGLDDGPCDLPEALELARMLLDQGVDTVVATPHQLGRYLDDAQLILRRRQEFAEFLMQQGLSLKVLPGADVRVDERIIELVRQRRVLTLADGGGYLLLEMPHETRIGIEDLLSRFRLAGLTPIISHPERHRPVQQDIKIVGRWIREGALIQLTADSLLGRFDRAARSTAMKLLKHDWVHFVASDAHGARKRPPRLREAFELLKGKFGEEVAQRLCAQNPARAVAGQKIPGKVFEGVPC